MITKLQDAAIKALNTPAVRDRLTKAGAEPVGSTAEEFRLAQAAEMTMWGELIRTRGIRMP